MDRFKYFIVVLIVMGIGTIGFYLTKERPKEDPTIKSLLQVSAIKNNTKDVMDDIGIKTIEDVGYYIEDNIIYITYGKHKIEVETSILTDNELKQDLNKLHIEIFKTKDGDYVIKYKNQEVKEVVVHTK